MKTTETDLNDIKIPLADLRALIVDLMKDGTQKIPLGDLLFLIRQLYRETK